MMNHTSSPSQHHEDKVSSEETLLTNGQELIPTQQQVKQKSARSWNPEQNEHRAERPEPPSSRQRGWSLKVLATTLAIAISPLAVLKIGQAAYSYYSADQSFEQIAEPKQTDIAAQKRLLPILWIGTGAMVSGALAALWASRTIRLATITATAAKEQEAKKELAERTQFLANATEQIRASLNPKDIIEATVQEARQGIAADRVLFYSLDEQSQGKVIAESVAFVWPRALGATIDDPCFSAHYLEKYQNGRVQAIEDIHQANLTPCHLGQLEPFAVKANLVAPILNQGKLLGLLIAHQCDRPRAWQQLEIRWFALLARQVGLAIDNVRLSRQLAQVSQAVLQIPAVADSARSIAAKVQEVEPQILKTSQIATAGEQTVNSVVDSLTAIEAIVAESTVKVKHLIQSCQKNSQVVSLIKELGVYMKQQAINTTIKAGQAGDVTQEQVVSIAETVRFSTEQLATAIAEIESLTGEIETEAKDLVATMTVGTEQVVSGTESLEETRQELNQIATLNYRIIMLISRIAQAATDQVSTSTSVSQSIEKTVNKIRTN